MARHVVGAHGLGDVPLISRAYGLAGNAAAAAPSIETDVVLADAVLEAVPEALIVVDDLGCIARMNRRAELAFGVSRQDAIGEPLESLLPGVGAERARVGLRNDGSTFAVALSREDLQVGAERLQMLLVRDACDGHERLRRQEEFFVNASHELRAPVTALRASAEVLLETASGNLPEDGRRILANMAHDIERLASLMDDLLDLNSIREGRIHLHLAPCDLREVANQAVRAMQPLACRRHQKLELVLSAPAPAIADAELLGRAVLNLVDNACKYGRHGGRVAVHVETGLEEAMLTVSDDGPGIPEADLERVFQPYYRSPTPDLRRIQGNGLGLPLCRAVVDMHGGRVWAESTPGGGSTFRMALPHQRDGTLSSPGATGGPQSERV